MDRRLTVIGGGPAGSCAAITALRGGCSAILVEKSRFPRHKVCGEFLSPEIAPELERIGVWPAFISSAPARIDRLRLRFRLREFGCRLPERAYGLSRFCLDPLLMDRAMTLGPSVIRDLPERRDGAIVLCTGRKAVEPRSRRGRRIFGFKAHFRGPTSDAIELFFFDGGYVGVTAVEGGLTNVCGIATEAALRSVNFAIDDHVARSAALRERLEPLTRAMDWLRVGPLVYQNRFRAQTVENEFPAGDALSFVDPFTGSGILAAVITGALAGECIAQGISSAEYMVRCRKRLRKPFAVASLFRTALGSGFAERLAAFVPASWLYRLTRPSLAGRA